MDTLLERSLGEKVQVEVRLSSDLWPVKADLSQLEVALLNIALNARDAMPDGGTIIFVGDNTNLQMEHRTRFGYPCATRV